jgi:Mg2+-importing ATPase
VVATGASTQFGPIAQRLATQRADSEFERALNRLGYLLTSVMLVMVLLVFAAHMLMGRPALETLLFALALAVGLSPELLPVTLNVNLARAATTMAQEGVLVRHLGAIENLGSMDILCCDKTGTLTAGVIELLGAYDPQGQPSEAVLLRGALNAAFETGVPSPLDEAILATLRPPVGAYEKLAEIPFDFIRKCVSVVVQGPEGIELISKGAFPEVIERCDRLPDGTPLNDAVRAELTRQQIAWNAEGIRILACAAKILPTAANDFRHEESHMTFLGFLAFLDLPKPDAARTLASLAAWVMEVMADMVVILLVSGGGTRGLSRGRLTGQQQAGGSGLIMC